MKRWSRTRMRQYAYTMQLSYQIALLPDGKSYVSGAPNTCYEHGISVITLMAPLPVPFTHTRRELPCTLEIVGWHGIQCDQEAAITQN
jgi:hypothetical protein